MSINVTVTGSPVCITRGKMVTADMDSYKKSEVQRRRKVRLEQVRQQSKDIANDLRQRVRQEAHRQLSNLENQQGAELKHWQAKKLLSLQQQYQDCVEHIGAAHTEAILHAKEVDNLKERSKTHTKKAKQRGNNAAKALHERQQSENEIQSHSKQRKNIVKSIEKVRSSCVSNAASMGRRKNKREESRLEVSIDYATKEQRVPEEDIESFDEFSSMVENQVPSIRSKGSSIGIIPDLELSDDMKDKGGKQYDPSLYQDSTVFSQNQSVCKDTKASFDRNQKSDTYTFVKPYDYPYDSRISDHIRQRIISHNDPKYPSSFIVPHRLVETVQKAGVDAGVQSDISVFNKAMETRSAQADEHHLANIVQEDISRHETVPETNQEPQIMSKKLLDSAKTLVESSKKLTVASTKLSKKLKDPPGSSKTSTYRGVSQKNKSVEFEESNNESSKKSSQVLAYDHSNRFTHSYTPKESLVEKTKRFEEQQVPEGSDVELHTREMAERELMAKKRGREALDREKSEREYKSLLNNLSNIQKADRLNSDHRPPSKAHLSDDRFKEKLDKEQKKIEEAIEAIYPEIRDTPLITLDKVHRDESRRSDVAFETVNVNKSDVPQINIAQWNLPQASQEDTDQKEPTLQMLLDRINAQRKLLSAEVPDDGDLRQLFERLENMTQTEEFTTSISKKRRTFSTEKPSTPSVESSESSPTIVNQSKKMTPTTSKNKLKTSKSPIKSVAKKSIEITKKNRSTQVEDEEVEPIRLETKSKSHIEVNESQGDIHIVIKLNDDNTSSSLDARHFNNGQKISRGDVATQKSPSNQTDPNTILASRVFPDSSWKSVLVEQTKNGTEENIPRQQSSVQWSKFSPGANSTTTSSSTTYYEPPTSYSMKHSSQQLDLSTSTEEQNLNENVKDLINHLLGMSRNTLDNLAVSPSSSIPTPEPHVVATNENFPQSFTKMSPTIQIVPSRSEILSEPSLPSSNNTIPTSSTNDSINNDLLADFYTSRIAVLNDLIEKVRSQTDSLLDKIKDPDSTEYLSLPSPQPEKSATVQESERNYLRSLLKQQSVQSNIPSNLVSSQFHDTKSSQQQTNIDTSQMGFIPISPAEKSQGAFVPLLAGIPKVPSLSSEEHSNNKSFDRNMPSTSQVMENSNSDLERTRRKPRPPPAIVQNIIRHNMGDLDSVPFHELSTIIEADSSRNIAEKSDLRPIEHQSQIQMQPKNHEADGALNKTCSSCVLCKVGTELIKITTCLKPSSSSQPENAPSSNIPFSTSRTNQDNFQPRNSKVKILSNVQVHPGSNLANQSLESNRSHMAPPNGQSFVQMRPSAIKTSPSNFPSGSSQGYFVDSQNTVQQRPLTSSAYPSGHVINSQIQSPSLNVSPIYPDSNQIVEPQAYSSGRFHQENPSLMGSKLNQRSQTALSNASGNKSSTKQPQFPGSSMFVPSHTLPPNNNNRSSGETRTSANSSRYLGSQKSTFENINPSNVSAVKNSSKNVASTFSQQGGGASVTTEQPPGYDTSPPTDRSSSISSSMEDVMKQLGLSWAIPTMKKTQQSLQMSGSSNSPEINRNVSHSGNNSPIDVSLKNVLKKEHSRRISESSSSNSSKNNTTAMTSYPSIPNLENPTNDSNVDQTISLMEQKSGEFSGRIPQKKFTDKSVVKSKNESSSTYDHTANMMSSRKVSSPANVSESSADSTISMMEFHASPNEEPSKFGLQIPIKGFGSVETQMDYSHSTDSTISQMNITDSSNTPSIGQVKTKPFSPKEYSSSSSSTILPDAQRPYAHSRGRTSTPIYERHPAENVSSGSSLFHSDISEVRIHPADGSKPLTTPHSSLDVEQTLSRIRNLHKHTADSSKHVSK